MRSWRTGTGRKRSYPVKLSVLEAAVALAGITISVEFARTDSSKEGCFTASYFPTGSFPKGEHFELSCRSVQSVYVGQIRSALEAEGIPQFIEWAKGIEALDHNSPARREHQHFKWVYPDATG